MRATLSVSPADAGVVLKVSDPDPFIANPTGGGG